VVSCHDNWLRVNMRGGHWAILLHWPLGWDAFHGLQPAEAHCPGLVGVPWSYWWRFWPGGGRGRRVARINAPGMAGMEPLHLSLNVLLARLPLVALGAESMQSAKVKFPSVVPTA